MRRRQDVKTISLPTDPAGGVEGTARHVAAASSTGVRAGGISASRLEKRFRRRGSSEDVVAIDDVSIDVHPGELVVLLGPSGCGKTTLLRCVAGLETPDGGRISVDDRVVFDAERSVNLPVNRRDLSIIFQGYALWPHMTVAKNVAYPLQSRGERNRSELNRRVSGVLEMVGLDGLQREYPGTLSGGQQQRVSLARALVNDPAVILFDEPLSNVDAKVRIQLRTEILAMHRRVGFAALYVTHDQSEALSVGTRIAVLDNGRIAQLGTPEEIYANPTSKYVAEFVGRANSVPVEIGAEDGANVLARSVLGDLWVPKARLADPEARSGFAIVRPEDVRMTSPAAGGLGATVVATEYQGSFYEVSVETDAGTALRIELSKGSVVPQAGERVGIELDPSRMRVVSR